MANSCLQGSLQLSTGCLFLACSLAQLFPQDFTRRVLRDDVKEDDSAGDALDGGDFAVHEGGNVVRGGGLAGFQDDVGPGAFIVCTT